MVIGDVRGVLRRGRCVARSTDQVTGAESCSTTFKPSSSVRAFAVSAPSARPHAMCAEPGPWHASHETSISEYVVRYVSVAASYAFARFVEWHSAHMKFQFWYGPVQWRMSSCATASFGYRWNQRWPPSFAGRASHTTFNA